MGKVSQDKTIEIAAFFAGRVIPLFVNLGSTIGNPRKFTTNIKDPALLRDMLIRAADNCEELGRVLREGVELFTNNGDEDSDGVNQSK